MSDPIERWSADQISRTVRDRIERSDYRPGARLPGRRRLMEEFGAADRTVAVALHRLRTEGLIYAVPGSGWFVRSERGVVRSTRNRLSREERAAGRGTFSSDCAAAGLTPDVDTHITTGPAPEVIAAELQIEPGDEVLVRDRVMRGGDEVLQLAASHLPRSITAGTAIEQENSGPGGIYARLEDAGHELTEFTERVSIGRASEHEARLMDLSAGDPVYRIVRTAWSRSTPVEVNHITITGDRYELVYELPAP